MQPLDDKQRARFQRLLLHELTRVKSGGAQIYASFVLMAVGTLLSFMASHFWGNTRTDVAVIIMIVLFGSVTTFLVTNDEPTRKLASGVLIAFWIGGMEPDQKWLGLTGVAVQLVACFLALSVERAAKSVRSIEDDFEYRLAQLNWEQANQHTPIDESTSPQSDEPQISRQPTETIR